MWNAKSIRNTLNLCFPAISDYCDYDSGSTDNLPKVQIVEKNVQIWVGAE